jgi:hypothetical protein
MDTRNRYDKQGRQLRNLALGDTFSLIGRSGSVVRVLQGRTWITQEGDAHDYVVPAGMSFCAARNGHIVVNAVVEDTRIAIYHVHPMPAVDWAHNRVRVDPDFVLTARREAQREMARYVAGLISRLWHRIRRTWTRRAVLRRHAPARTHGYHG